MQHYDLFQLAFDVSPDAQIIIQADNRLIVAVNQAFLGFTGFERGEVGGQAISGYALLAKPLGS